MAGVVSGTTVFSAAGAVSGRTVLTWGRKVEVLDGRKANTVLHWRRERVGVLGVRGHASGREGREERRVGV